MSPESLSDPFNLQRFVDAQESTYERALSELAAGQKRTHWMWFIFPQIHGLGFSAMAQRFAISGLKEAEAYLEHPILGLRLRECTSLVNGIQQRQVTGIFGYPDDLKFHSSITLFAVAASRLGNACRVFEEAKQRYFDGAGDSGTLKILNLAE